jgi:hypothetical protein
MTPQCRGRLSRLARFLDFAAFLEALCLLRL